jgi:hypothetical protein
MITDNELKEKSLLNELQNQAMKTIGSTRKIEFLDPTFKKENFKINLEKTNLEFLSKNQIEQLNDIKNRIQEVKIFLYI